jgi:hypothetical protein
MRLRLAPLINNLQRSPMCTGAGLTGAATVIGIGHTAITATTVLTAIMGTTGLTRAAGMDTGHTDTTVIGAVLIGVVTAIGVTGAGGNGTVLPSALLSAPWGGIGLTAKPFSKLLMHKP